MSDELFKYVITLYKMEDLDQFYKDMEEMSSKSTIPNRPVEVVNRSPNSANTYYWLTEEEAKLVEKDPRVWYIDKANTDPIITFDTFSRGYNNTASNQVNWGLWRCTKDSNPTNWGDGKPADPQTGTVSLSATGKNVDVVILDAGHVNSSHPEFTGRVIKYNWWQHNPVVNPSNTATNYDYSVFNDATTANHANSVASTMAGKTQGWARSANIYTLSANSVPSYAQELAILYVAEFHKAKPVNPATGVKNPTIVNMSWDGGSAVKQYFKLTAGQLGPSPTKIWHETYVDKVVYRGTTYTKSNQTGDCGVYQNGVLKAAFPSTAAGTGYRITTTANSATAASVTPTFTNTESTFVGYNLPFPIQMFGKTVYRWSGTSTPWDFEFYDSTDWATANAVGSIRINSTDSVSGRGLSAIYMTTSGSAPNRKFTVRLLCTSSNASASTTRDTSFELTFYEATPAQIDLAIKDNPAGPYTGWANKQLLNFGLRYDSASGSKQMSIPYPPMITNNQAAIQAGVIVCVAGGNSNWRVVNSSSPDWNNSVDLRVIGIDGVPFTDVYTSYYCRGGGNNSGQISSHIISGSVDSYLNSSGLEQKASYSNTGNAIAVYSPGTNIYSAQVSGYATVSGTSFASPQTAGVLACMLELNPSWNQAQALSWLSSSGSGAGKLTDVTAPPENVYNMLGGPNKYLYYNAGTVPPQGTTVYLDVNPKSVSEDGVANLTFVFNRTGSTTNSLTVNYTVGGTATLGSDYAGISGTGTTKSITIPAGLTSVDLVIDPTADTTVEPDETIIITLTSGTGYTIGTTSPVTATITNDDSTPTTSNITLTVSPSSVTEDGAPNLVFTFARSGSTTNSLTVNYTVSGTATPGSDYTSTEIGTNTGSKTITIPAGASSATVTVNPTADTTSESDETVILTLNTGTGYIVSTTTPVTGIITNDDAASTIPTVYLSVSPASTPEDGATNLVFSFTRSAPITNAVTVNYTVSGTATPGTDYTGISSTGAKTITIPAGSSTTTLTVDPATDTVSESDETVILTLNTGTGYTLGTTNPVVGTIVNDDVSQTTTVTVALSPNNTSVPEDSSSTLRFVFYRSGSTLNSLTINYTAGGTATAGTDYPLLPAVTFAAGSAEAELIVDPNADTTYESDETVIITVVSGPNYVVGTPNSATGTITNDDQAPVNQTVTVTASPTQINENSTSPVLFTFTRSGNTSNALTVNYTVAGTATSGTDYTGFPDLTNKSISFAAGSVSASVSVNMINDTQVESNETIIVNIATGTGYTIGSPSSATATIISDDSTGTPTVSVALAATNTSVPEDGPTNLTFVFNRSGSTTNALTVYYSVGGTATLNTDYTGIPTTTTKSISIPAGASTATVVVDPIADTVVEPDETVIITLVAGAGYNIGTPNSATGTILNDDSAAVKPTVTLTLSPTSVNENSGQALVYTLTRTGSTASALGVSFDVSGTATANTDYVGVVTGYNSRTIPAGSASTTISVTPIADTLSEPNETVALRLAASTTYNISPVTDVIGTIVNVNTPAPTKPTLTASMQAATVTGSNWNTYYLSQPSNWHYSDNSYYYNGFSNYGYETVSPKRTNFGSMSPLMITRSSGVVNGVRQVLWGSTGTTTSEFCVKMSGHTSYVYPDNATVTLTITGKLSGITRTVSFTSGYTYTTPNSNGDYVRTWVFGNPSNYSLASGTSYGIKIEMSA